MSIEVYWGSGSTPSWRVLLAMHHKGIPFESRLISFSQREHKTAGFLAMNPRGKVPALRDGDFCLNESLAILAWIDRKVADPPLFGRTANGAGRVWRALLEHENHGLPAINPLARPLLFRQETTHEILMAALAGAVAELDWLHDRTSPAGFIEGVDLSAADITWYSTLRFLDRAMSRPSRSLHGLEPLSISTRWPHLGALARNVEAIPYFEETVPPHWLEGEHASGLHLG